MSFTIVLLCPKHRDYQAKLPPRVECDECDAMYACRQTIAGILETPRAERPAAQDQILDRVIS